MSFQNHIPSADYRIYLRDAFDHRKLKNPAYSLRCFARDIDISPSMLSGVLNRKKNLAEKKAVKIAKYLDLSHHQLKLFLWSVNQEGMNAPSQLQRLKREAIEHESYGKSLTLAEEKFQYMSDPKSMALLALFGLKSFRSRVDWISERLGIFQYQSAKLLARLKSLAILKEDSPGKYEVDHFHVFSSDGVSSQAIRKFHQTSLEHALVTIQSVPVEERDFYSTIFAIDEQDYGSMQAEVRDFHRKIYLKYARKESASRVYAIQNQLIPYSTRGSS